MDRRPALGKGAHENQKAGVELLTRVWADEFGRAGVRVNAVAAGDLRRRAVCRLEDRRMRAEVAARGEAARKAVGYLASGWASIPRWWRSSGVRW